MELLLHLWNRLTAAWVSESPLVVDPVRHFESVRVTVSKYISSLSTPKECVVKIRVPAGTGETSEVVPKRKRRASPKATVTKEINDQDTLQGRITLPSHTTLA